MENKQEQQVVDTTMSYLTLRKLLGALGILLPLLLLIFNEFKVQASISHFYYTKSSVVFTSILFAFGLFLFSYRGRLKEKELVSDKTLTNIGGILAVLTAIIPTAVCQLDNCDFTGIQSSLANLSLEKGVSTQFIHNDKWIGITHLICAVGFLTIMGWMSFNRFTKGNTTPRKKIFYRFCAFMVWLPIIALGVLMKFDLKFTNYDIFIGEWISLFFFGISWLVKGKGLEKFGV
mgnify:CR=1 FL=1